jgi:hypothetical protein
MSQRNSETVRAEEWRRGAHLALAMIASVVGGCGGGVTAPPPPPAADFTISASPAELTQQAGGTSAPVGISVGGLNGFSGSVNVSLSGLPPGATSTPASPFAVAAGGTQNLTLTVPSATAVGDSRTTVTGTSGGLSHTASLKLTVTAAKDFSLGVSPAQIAATIGGVSQAFTVSVTGENGFTDNVTLSITGLPAGTTSLPASPFTVTAGARQNVAVNAPMATAVGNFSLQVGGTSGSSSHNAQVGLTVLPVIKTYDTGDMLYLETDTSTETTKLGLRKAWGDSIVEVSLNGTNYVNSDDPGRQIQTSLWDSNANYSSSWGYNPIEAGDHFFDGSPALAATLNPDSLYTKTQPIQWAPENFGGGAGAPVLGDAYVEKWLSVVPGYNKVFKLHYKITHFGTDSHADAPQELPVMYVNPIVSNFFYYGGNAPWTNDALSQFTMPGGCCAYLYTPEDWGAYVDNTNTGIALFTPGQYPDSKGFNAGSALQFTPTCPYSWNPGSVLEFNTYILVGSLNESRGAINEMHKQETGPSPLTPFGYFNPPPNPLQGTALLLQGWVWSLVGISSVDVFIDGSKIGSATYGIADPGVGTVFPGAPANVGFQYSLDTTKFTNGNHTMTVKAADVNGKVATFSTAQVNISN